MKTQIALLVAGIGMTGFLACTPSRPTEDHSASHPLVPTATDSTHQNAPANTNTDTNRGAAVPGADGLNKTPDAMGAPPKKD